MAALPAGLALPLGAAVLAAAAAQLGAVGRRSGNGALSAPRVGSDSRGDLLMAVPAWLLLGLALALGAALPEPVASALAEAARQVR